MPLNNATRCFWVTLTFSRLYFCSPLQDGWFLTLITLSEETSSFSSRCMHKDQGNYRHIRYESVNATFVHNCVVDIAKCLICLLYF